MFDNLTFAELEASFLVKETLELPSYPGSTIRGCLGWALREVSYGSTQSCPSCPNRSYCRYCDLYTYMFETPSDHPFVSKNLHFQQYELKAYPQPIIIYPPMGGVYLEGDLLTFKITVVGFAINFLPFLCCGLRLMETSRISGGVRKIELHGIRDCLGELMLPGKNKIEKNTGKGMIPRTVDMDYFQRQAEAYINTTSLKVNFLTPFRFQYKNRIGKELSFYVFMKNLLRRITLLSIHSPLAVRINYSELLKRAESVCLISSHTTEWYDWGRYSSKQRAKMRLGGLVGEIVFSGDLGMFMPYIMMGQYLHVGKGGSFGLGKYVIVETEGGIINQC